MLRLYKEQLSIRMCRQIFAASAAVRTLSRYLNHASPPHQRRLSDGGAGALSCRRDAAVLRRREAAAFHSLCAARSRRLSARICRKRSARESSHRRTQMDTDSRRRVSWSVFIRVDLWLISYASISRRTCASPSGPIRRCCKPWNGKVSFHGSSPSKCRIVACRSWTLVLPSVMK